MNTKKGSKNSIENRGKTHKNVCSNCGGDKKAFRVMGQGKTKMAYECNCGLIDNAGTLIK